MSVKTNLINPAVTSFNEGGEISPPVIIKHSGYNCKQKTLKPQL